MPSRLRKRTIEEVQEHFGQRLLKVADDYTSDWLFEQYVRKLIREEVMDRLRTEIDNVLRAKVREAIERLDDKQVDKVVKSELQRRLARSC